MYIYHHKVQYYETDKMGVTHHSNYIRFMEEARTDFLEQIGWPYEKLEETGAFSPVTSVECEFKSPTGYSDIINIEVWIEELKGARLKIGYLMTKSDGSIVCRAKSEHCFLDVSGRPMRLRKELPEFYTTLSELVSKSK